MFARSRLLIALALGLAALLLGLPGRGGAEPSPSRKRAAHGGRGAGRGCRDLFCSSPQVVRLDETSEDSRRLTAESVEKTMNASQAVFVPCLLQARRADPGFHRARVELVVSAEGRVLASRVAGRPRTPLARCIAKGLRDVRFARSALPRTVGSFTLVLPEP
jgi:hypothetical protein